ncbi:MAG: hypothetical protein U0559_05300 [Anaerolineae bacterium]
MQIEPVMLVNMEGGMWVTTLRLLRYLTFIDESTRLSPSQIVFAIVTLGIVVTIDFSSFASCRAIQSAR